MTSEKKKCAVCGRCGRLDSKYARTCVCGSKEFIKRDIQKTIFEKK